MDARVACRCGNQLLHQENVFSLLSANICSVISPAKSERLGLLLLVTDFEKQTLGFWKCASVHFRLLFVLSATLKVIGGFPDKKLGMDKRVFVLIS